MGQIGTPTGALVGGVQARTVILQDYVFQSGIHEPEVENILAYKYPQYYLTALLDRIGESGTIAQDVFSWFTMDRTRKSGTVSNILEGDGTAWDPGTSVSARIEIAEFEYVLASGMLGYAQIGDVFRSEGGTNLLVTAIGGGATDTDAQLLTVAKLDGSAIEAVELSDGFTIGHVFNSFEEASSAPKGRTYLPDQNYNYTTILRRSFKISGSEFTNKTYVNGGKAWYFEQEAIEMKEMARDKEGVVMFGTLSTGTNRKTTRGVWDFVETDGQDGTFVGDTGVSETNIQDFVKLLLVEGSSSKILCLCGAQFLTDVQIAMKDYFINGAINYGGFGGNEVGIDVQSYRFLGKTIDFVHYALFNDTAMVPYAGTASSTKVDFDNTGLFLDMGVDDNGKALISLKYKEHGGQSRKFIHGYETGMMSPDGSNGGHISNGDDAFSIHMLCEVTVKVNFANRMGILRATS
jgi:hypothetical protein